MRLVIIESPYAGDVDTNERYARACMLDSIRRGEAPFVSHLLYTQVLDDQMPEERQTGIEALHAWRRAADVCVVYDDLGMSAGMVAGIEASKGMGQPIEWRSLPSWNGDAK